MRRHKIKAQRGYKAPCSIRPSIIAPNHFNLEFTVDALTRADVFDYIEVFYNRTRRHSHLGGVSPEAFERASL